MHDTTRKGARSDRQRVRENEGERGKTTVCPQSRFLITLRKLKIEAVSVFVLINNHTTFSNLMKAIWTSRLLYVSNEPRLSE